MVLLLSNVQSTSNTCEFPSVLPRLACIGFLMPLTAGNVAWSLQSWRQRADVSELLREHPRQRFAWHDALYGQSRNSLFLRNFPFLLLKYFSVRHLFLKRSSFIGPWPGPGRQNFVISFLFQNSALFTNKSTKREPALTETENSKFKIQNTNPDRMQQQSGMFSSVFNLNVWFNLSDDMSTFRARPVCELYNIFETNHIAGPLQRSNFYFEKFVSLTFSPFCCCVIWL